MLKREKDRLLRMLRPHIESPDFRKPVTEQQKQELAEYQRRNTSLGELICAARDLLEAPQEANPLDYARQVTEESWQPMHAGFSDMMSLISYPLDARTSRVLAADAILKLTSMPDLVAEEDTFSQILQKVANRVASAALCIMAAQREKRESRASERAQSKADSTHKQHRARKAQAKETWLSREWKRQADAEREIAKRWNVTQAVAGRWIREFKGDAHRAQQSKHPARHDQ